MRTWHIEASVVAVVLFIQLYFFSHFTVSEVICSFAVLLTFKHAQIADRMQERQALMENPDVHCYRWSNRYFVMKETLWIVFFLMTKSYSALSGAIIFSIYPLWRRYWRKINPIIK